MLQSSAPPPRFLPWRLSLPKQPSHRDTSFFGQLGSYSYKLPLRRTLTSRAHALVLGTHGTAPDQDTSTRRFRSTRSMGWKFFLLPLRPVSIPTSAAIRRPLRLATSASPPPNSVPHRGWIWQFRQIITQSISHNQPIDENDLILVLIVLH